MPPSPPPPPPLLLLLLLLLPLLLLLGINVISAWKEGPPVTVDRAPVARRAVAVCGAQRLAERGRRREPDCPRPRPLPGRRTVVVVVVVAAATAAAAASTATAPCQGRLQGAACDINAAALHPQARQVAGLLLLPPLPTPNGAAAGLGAAVR